MKQRVNIWKGSEYFPYPLYMSSWLTQLCVVVVDRLLFEILTVFFLEIVFSETNRLDLGSTFQINNDSKVMLHGNQHQNNIHKQDFPTHDEELIKWAIQKFGGVTSFTTVRNLHTMSSTGTKGESCFWFPELSR